MTKDHSLKRSVSVVLPAYNEEDGIQDVLSALRAAFDAARGRLIAEYEILVVDDGSKDGTAEIAEKSGARVIRHPTNMGYGKSLLTGFDEARFDWLLTLDADGSYSADDAVALLGESPDFDMVVGARQGSFFWGNPGRALLRRLYLMLASFVAGYKVPDANSGIRLIRKTSMVKTMPVLCLGYSLSTTMTLSFLQAGRFVKFFPVSYLARKGKSKVSLPRDILRTLQIMVQVILYYNPLKFAVVLTMIPLAFAAMFAAQLAYWPTFGELAMLTLSLLCALAVFIFGCLLESQRLHNK
ncbi:glycosyltransferase family 2 protein [Elusimicrobiota bacterium]